MLFILGLRKFVCERVTLLFHGAECLGHGELPRNLTGIEPSLQFLNLGVLGSGSLLQFVGDFRLGEFDGASLILLGELKSLVQLLLEIAVANLLQNIRVPSLVDLECFPAVRAGDFMHDYLEFRVDRRHRAVPSLVSGSGASKLLTGQRQAHHLSQLNQLPIMARFLMASPDLKATHYLIASRGKAYGMWFD